MVSPPHGHAICGVADVKYTFTYQISYHVYNVFSVAIYVRPDLEAL